VLYSFQFLTHCNLDLLATYGMGIICGDHSRAREFYLYSLGSSRVDMGIPETMDNLPANHSSPSFVLLQLESLTAMIVCSPTHIAVHILAHTVDGYIT
jgi:hypothetical protein